MNSRANGGMASMGTSDSQRAQPATAASTTSAPKQPQQPQPLMHPGMHGFSSGPVYATLPGSSSNAGNGNNANQRRPSLPSAQQQLHAQFGRPPMLHLDSMYYPMMVPGPMMPLGASPVAANYFSPYPHLPPSLVGVNAGMNVIPGTTGPPSQLRINSILPAESAPSNNVKANATVEANRPPSAQNPEVRKTPAAMSEQARDASSGPTGVQNARPGSSNSNASNSSDRAASGATLSANAQPISNGVINSNNISESQRRTSFASPLEHFSQALEVTPGNMIHLYASFLAEYHPKVFSGHGPRKSTCTISDHVGKFEDPPKYGNGFFTTYQMFNIVKELGGFSTQSQGDIWWQTLLRRLGFDAPNKIFLNKIKEWAKFNHLTSFFDFLLGHRDSFTASAPTPPLSASGEDAAGLDELVQAIVFGSASGGKAVKRKRSKSEGVLDVGGAHAKAGGVQRPLGGLAIASSAKKSKAAAIVAATNAVTAAASAASTAPGAASRAKHKTPAGEKDNSDSSSGSGSGSESGSGSSSSSDSDESDGEEEIARKKAALMVARQQYHQHQQQQQQQIQMQQQQIQHHQQQQGQRPPYSSQTPPLRMQQPHSAVGAVAAPYPALSQASMISPPQPKATVSAPHHQAAPQFAPLLDSEAAIMNAVNEAIRAADTFLSSLPPPPPPPQRPQKRPPIIATAEEVPADTVAAAKVEKQAAPANPQAVVVTPSDRSLERAAFTTGAADEALAASLAHPIRIVPSGKLRLAALAEQLERLRASVGDLSASSSSARTTSYSTELAIAPSSSLSSSTTTSSSSSSTSATLTTLNAATVTDIRLVRIPRGPSCLPVAPVKDAATMTHDSSSRDAAAAAAAAAAAKESAREEAAAAVGAENAKLRTLVGDLIGSLRSVSGVVHDLQARLVDASSTTAAPAPSSTTTASMALVPSGATTSNSVVAVVPSALRSDLLTWKRDVMALLDRMPDVTAGVSGM